MVNTEERPFLKTLLFPHLEPPCSALSPHSHFLPEQRQKEPWLLLSVVLQEHLPAVVNLIVTRCDVHIHPGTLILDTLLLSLCTCQAVLSFCLLGQPSLQLWPTLWILRISVCVDSSL